MLAIVFAAVTVIAIITLALIRTLRPDRQARGLTELAVLLSAYGAVYGPVGIGFVVQLRHGPDLSLLPSFLSGALAGALLAILLPGGLWLAALLTLWVLRRPLELPSTRMAVRSAVLLVVALALVFGLGMHYFEAVEDRGVLIWVGSFLFYTSFFVAQSFVVPWLTFLRLPRLGESPESERLQSWVDEIMTRRGQRPIAVRVHEGGLVNAFVLWGIRKPWLLVGEGLLKEMAYAEVRAVLAHEISHVIRRDHVRLLLSGLAWAAAITVCSRLVLVPLLQADRSVLFITVLATFNTLYLVALGVVMRRMEYATDRLAVELLDGRGTPLASALERLAEFKRAPLEQKSLTHPSVRDRVNAIHKESADWLSVARDSGESTDATSSTV
ncbi:MAG: M48 family metalloprotease [Gemmatimonadetes bacterium]|nr:M48 family metalloprotease [Gemmatimonadota bacterium]MYB06348.1 M48 family metalloprotease [Gemmatimonadota bacterium]MYE18178.1 M48 family metalloprotease [Gemmatimonadota bacterium]MYG21867.1 M48 family metalloprotease [Gemmatimonadota bacterium]MYJ38617.1 M48 family metalloprotease [Gemmatimonadota bacterium]